MCWRNIKRKKKAMKVEEAEKKNKKNTTRHLHIFVGWDITCFYEMLMFYYLCRN